MLHQNNFSSGHLTKTYSRQQEVHQCRLHSHQLHHKPIWMWCTFHCHTCTAVDHKSRHLTDGDIILHINDMNYLTS